jgi:hypothetical protein
MLFGDCFVVRDSVWVVVVVGVDVGLHFFVLVDIVEYYRIYI